MRVSAIIGIFGGLQVIFGERVRDEWVRLANSGPIFGGKSPLEFMIEGGLEAMIAVRRYVDAKAAGN
jgi:hypothetical protein